MLVPFFWLLFVDDCEVIPRRTTGNSTVGRKEEPIRFSPFN